ncbi:MAG TPA: tetrahydrofolate dehydrogenase/cyclohydrolase catalytic domain-containing protein, partial [Ilumatobacteraceae bacterium]|nr:tetrahydrofolate dehydrogenase/cyclohydrolase catalytic domain-containing protein [Ilumatobacteraceae bacterium]
MITLDGIALRNRIVDGLRATIDAAGSPPVCLATILVGDDKPSQIYVRNKHRLAEKAGMVSRQVELPASASQAQVEDAAAQLANDP